MIDRKAYYFIPLEVTNWNGQERLKELFQKITLRKRSYCVEGFWVPVCCVTVGDAMRWLD